MRANALAAARASNDDFGAMMVGPFAESLDEAALAASTEAICIRVEVPPTEPTPNSLPSTSVALRESTQLVIPGDALQTGAIAGAFSDGPQAGD